MHPAYVAGFLDADGCIAMRHGKPDKKGWRHHSVTVIVVQADRTIPDLFAAQYGGNVGINARNVGISAGRAYYRWTASGSKARQLLTDALPHLQTKRSQAEIALDYLDHAAGIKKRGGGPGSRGIPQSITKEVLAYREGLWLRMKELNTCHKRRAAAETKPSDPIIGDAIVRAIG
jgi:hypothetical protein